MKTIVTQGLGFSYEKLCAVDNVSLTIERGQFCGLIGPNGCGKSTLLQLLSGVLRPETGVVRLDEKDLQELEPRERAVAIGYVPQQHSRVFPFTALEVVLTGRSPHTSRFQFESNCDKEIAIEALDRVGASHLSERPITELSGGEQQMVTLARAIAQRARLLLLDEPVAALDLKHRGRLMRVLKDLREEGELTAVVVTHDFQMLDESFDQLFAMRKGRLVADGMPQEVLNVKTLADLYGDPGLRVRRIDGTTFVWSEG